MPSSAVAPNARSRSGEVETPVQRTEKLSGQRRCPARLRPDSLAMAVPAARQRRAAAQGPVREVLGEILAARAARG
jgi:hypothetical protein